MKCEECRGACCEFVELPVFKGLGSEDANRWLGFHGAREGNLVKLEVRCSQLTLDGLCSIYNQRPQVCINYKPGGTDCMKAVKARRSLEEYRRIRDVGDPLAI